MTRRWVVVAAVIFLAPLASAMVAYDSVAPITVYFLIAWGVLVVVGVAGIMVLNRADRARLRELALTLRARRLDVCRRCGYDLVGSRESGVCPECGLEFQRFSAGIGPTEATRESPARGGANHPSE